jgi:predicted nucleotidyltransferase
METYGLGKLLRKKNVGEIYGFWVKPDCLCIIIEYICLVMNLIEENRDKINDLCLKYKVRRMFAFGSVITDLFKTDSDIDLIVDFKDVELYDYADNYFDLKDSLERLFHREVDLLEEKAIRNPYLRQSIDSTKSLIYG